MKKEFTLCAGRHETPVHTAVFEGLITDITDVHGLESTAYKRLRPYQGYDLTIYVTGLTIALIAVLNVAKQLGIDVTLMHYNNVTQKYFEQKVW